MKEGLQMAALARRPCVYAAKSPQVVSCAAFLLFLFGEVIFYAIFRTVYLITTMSWANHYIAKLKNGETVQFRPRGNSMKGKVESGQLVTVEPVNDRQLQNGDIVLCKVNGSQYLHLIKGIQGERYQIGNNIGRINGWVTQNSIYGICTRVSV